MKYNHLKPIKRWKIRVALGKKYYTGRRYIDWIVRGEDYVKEKKTSRLPFLIAEHKTPLYRGLKDVDRVVDDHKVINLNLATKKINGIVIKPNEKLSYWKLIGNPSKSKGYVDGMVLDHGKYKMGVGGGLCQLSNLLYWMMLHSPLDIVERHRHSYDVFPDAQRTQPFGSGATCVYNYRDLQIVNNTEEDYQVVLEIDEEHLSGKLYASREKYLNYEVYESSHKISLEPWGGYLRHNTISRRVYDLSNNMLEDHYICENHALMMYAPLLSDTSNVHK